MTQYHGNVTSHFSLFLTFWLADWLECSFSHLIFKPAVDKSDDKETQRGNACLQTCDKPSNTGLLVDSNTAPNVYCLSTVEWTVELKKRFVLAAELSETSQKDPVVSQVLPLSIWPKLQLLCGETMKSVWEAKLQDMTHQLQS